MMSVQPRSFPTMKTSSSFLVYRLLKKLPTVAKNVRNQTKRDLKFGIFWLFPKSLYGKNIYKVYLPIKKTAIPISVNFCAVAPRSQLNLWTGFVPFSWMDTHIRANKYRPAVWPKIALRQGLERKYNLTQLFMTWPVTDNNNRNVTEFVYLQKYQICHSLVLKS